MPVTHSMGCHKESHFAMTARQQLGVKVLMAVMVAAIALTVAGVLFVPRSRMVAHWQTATEHGVEVVAYQGRRPVRWAIALPLLGGAAVGLGLLLWPSRSVKRT
jgi:H+/Cl- antiporter ClcA